VIVEVHPEPEKAWSDGDQSLTFAMFEEMMDELARPLRSVLSVCEVARAL
jgi:3-deoxy-7-phosphoheptulonate synthase